MTLRVDLEKFVARQQSLGAKIVPIESLERMLAENHPEPSSPWLIPCIAVGAAVALAMIAVVIALVLT